MTAMEHELRRLLLKYAWCIKVETKYTLHYIERLMSSAGDRGVVKWHAETIPTSTDDPEYFRSHIDYQDLFPRLYFFFDTFLREFFQWCEIRNIEIVSVTEL